MAYTFEQSYYFRPYRGNSSFWLNRYGNGSIASHQKATLYTAAGSADQRLKVHKVSGGCQLLSDLNNAYGLTEPKQGVFVTSIRSLATLTML